MLFCTVLFCTRRNFSGELIPPAMNKAQARGGGVRLLDTPPAKLGNDVSPLGASNAVPSGVSNGVVSAGASNTSTPPDMMLHAHADLDEISAHFSNLFNGLPRSESSPKLRLNSTDGTPVGAFPADPQMIQNLHGTFFNAYSLELQQPTINVHPSQIPLQRVKRAADSASFDQNPHDRPRLACRIVPPPAPPSVEEIASFNTNPKHPWRDVRHKQSQYHCQSCNKVTTHTTEEVSSRHCFPKKAEIQASTERPKATCEVATCMKCGQESQLCLAVASHGRLYWGTDTKGVTTKEKMTCTKCNALWKEARSKRDKSHKSLTMGMWTRCEYCKALYKFARGDDGHRTSDKCAERKYLESLPNTPPCPNHAVPHPRKKASKRDKDIVRDLLQRRVFETLPLETLKQIKIIVDNTLQT